MMGFARVQPILQMIGPTDSCAMPPIPDRVHQRVTWEPMMETNTVRASIGGYPILPIGESWPVCAEDGCNRRMALFLQFDVEDRFGLPFETGSTLGIFQCIEHD